MNWAGPAEFFNMGGYAFYVWSSFGSCVLIFALETWLAAKRRKNILRSLQSAWRAARLDKEAST